MGNRLTSFAKKLCANWEFGMCHGRETGTCHLDEGDRCPYFEHYVLPAAKEEKHHIQIYKLYGEINPEFKLETIRYCECGKPLLPKHRYCTECAKKRRKLTSRNAQRKYRRRNSNEK